MFEHQKEFRFTRCPTSKNFCFKCSIYELSNYFAFDETLTLIKSRPAIDELELIFQMKRMKELQEAGPRLSVREQLAANKRENELKNKSKHNTTPRNSIKPNSTQRNSIIPNIAQRNNTKTTHKDLQQTQQEKTNSVQQKETSEPESDQSSEKSEGQTFQSKRRTQQPQIKRQSQPAPRVSLRPRMSFAKQDNSKGIPVKG